MQITPHVEELQRQLINAAAASTAEGQELADRLVVALDAAARLALLQVVSEAAGEITRELSPGSVDVRLRGRDLDFVVTKPPAESGPDAASTPPAASAAAADDDDASTARTTLRLPDAMKARAEAAATAEGISLNTWLIRAVAGALAPQPRTRETRGSTYTGWVR